MDEVNCIEATCMALEVQRLSRLRDITFHSIDLWCLLCRCERGGDGEREREKFSSTFSRDHFQSVFAFTPISVSLLKCSTDLSKSNFRLAFNRSESGRNAGAIKSNERAQKAKTSRSGRSHVIDYTFRNGQSIELPADERGKYDSLIVMSVHVLAVHRHINGNSLGL